MLTYFRIFCTFEPCAGFIYTLSLWFHCLICTLHAPFPFSSSSLPRSLTHPLLLRFIAISSDCLWVSFWRFWPGAVFQPLPGSVTLSTEQGALLNQFFDISSSLVGRSMIDGMIFDTPARRESSITIYQWDFLLGK